MINEWRIVQLANSLIDRCVTTGTGSFNRIRSIGDVDVRLVHFLFENICQSIIEQMTVPIPDICTHPIDYVDFVIDTIAHKLLNVELRISSKVLYFIIIFIYQFLEICGRRFENSMVIVGYI
jgi:hypothetical protein